METFVHFEFLRIINPLFGILNFYTIINPMQLQSWNSENKRNRIYPCIFNRARNSPVAAMWTNGNGKHGINLNNLFVSALSKRWALVANSRANLDISGLWQSTTLPLLGSYLFSLCFPVLSTCQKSNVSQLVPSHPTPTKVSMATHTNCLNHHPRSPSPAQGNEHVCLLV